MRFRTLALTSIAIASSLILSSCDQSKSTNKKPTINPSQIENETQALNDWFAARYEDSLARSPMFRTYLGIKTDYDKLDDVSQAALDEEYAQSQEQAAQRQRQFNKTLLDTQGKISYRLADYNAKTTKSEHEFQGHEYVFDHMNGPHTGLPTFLINFHSVKTKRDAEAYIARIKHSRRYLGQYQARAEAQAKNGVLLPAFVYDKLIASANTVLTGSPFDDKDASPVLADFAAKVENLELPNKESAALIHSATSALTHSFAPAYHDLISMFESHKAIANDDAGVWKLPNGDAFYASRLQHYTTTDLNADEIHTIGLREVARIQTEMRAIMKQVKFNGTVQEFYEFLRTDPQFTYSNDDAGRTKYMTEATAIIDDMRSRLDSLFITKPIAKMIVKRVEPFRESSAGGAFYDLPAQDGSRPGTYFINLKDVREQPTYLMQALAYHEGIPGHHMQLAIAQELTNIPDFRKQSFYTAYVEGWGLYAESVPAELGLYKDPYKNFGRLSMEIFRAARLVVDTGLHSKHWSREQAVQYMLENIANPEGDIRAEIDRYIVWPGQATAYMIGKIKITELRAQAETMLGDKFDVREFHDLILASGALPLSVLEDRVNDWITEKG